MLRDIAYSFIYNSSTNLSVVTRISIPVSIVLYLLVNPFLKLKPLANLIYITPALLMALTVICISGSFKRILGGLQFVMLFMVIGLMINLLAGIFGFWTTNLVDVAIASMRGAVMFMTITLIFQWVKIEEIQWLLEKIGLGRLGVSIAVAFSQLPHIIVMYLEALVTVKLKYGSRYLYKVLLPLTLYTINHAREVAEAIYIHGMSKCFVDVSIKIKDVIIMILFSFILLIALSISLIMNAFL
uniref:Energy-coupling factor transporter transmembrane protein EcfT n=1 Tax=Ignisphaera aggregans TaxID=334771 RepID=A0A7C5UTR2_9CREN